MTSNAEFFISLPLVTSSEVGCIPYAWTDIFLEMYSLFLWGKVTSFAPEEAHLILAPRFVHHHHLNYGYFTNLSPSDGVEKHVLPLASFRIHGKGCLGLFKYPLFISLFSFPTFNNCAQITRMNWSCSNDEGESFIEDPQARHYTWTTKICSSFPLFPLHYSLITIFVWVVFRLGWNVVVVVALLPTLFSYCICTVRGGYLP